MRLHTYSQDFLHHCLTIFRANGDVPVLSLPGFFDPHNLFFGGLVAHATFAVILALLALSDRRSIGIRWLAGAGAVEFLSSGLELYENPAVSTHRLLLRDILLLSSYALSYLGLRWFSVRRALNSLRWPAVFAVVTLGAIVFAKPFPLAASDVVRCEMVIMLVLTVEMLWRTHWIELRLVSRSVAVLCGLMMLLLIGRIAIAGMPNQKILALYGHGAMLMVLILLEFSFVAMFVAETNRRLHEETRLDSLTGLRNRRSFEEIAKRELELAVNHRLPLALLMLDMDRFKALNDTWGHALGDRALRAVGGVLLRVVGDPERVARLGGEEFAVLLPGYSMETAVELAERLRVTVAGLRLTEHVDTTSLTVSIGVSCMRPGEHSWEPLLERADVALYQAKREGRNRVAECVAVNDTVVPTERTSDWRRFFAGRGPLL